MHRPRLGRPRKRKPQPDVQRQGSANAGGGTQVPQKATTSVVPNSRGDPAPTNVSGPRPEDLAGAAMAEGQERALAFDIGRAHALGDSRAPEISDNAGSAMSEEQECALAFDIGRAHALGDSRAPEISDNAGSAMSEEQERALAFDIGRAHALGDGRAPEIPDNDLAGSAMSEEQERALASDIGRAQALDNDCVRAPETFDNGPNLHWPIDDETGVAQIVLFISMFSSLCFSLSRVSSDILLRLLKLLVQTVTTSNLPNNVAEQVLANIPKSSRTVRSRYDLAAEPEQFAVCPRCHSLVTPSSRDPQTQLSIYPELCRNASNPPGAACGEKLLDSDGKRPKKKFAYNSVRKFIGRLLSEVETEKLIEKSCTDLLNTQPQDITELRGPFDSQFLRGLEGHRPGVLFVDGGDELRLAFSLNVDFFNVEGVKSGAASVSCGIIALTCLNLPAEIRYNDEYMHLAGIIPGPDEPSVTELDCYLKPLVDEFLKLWDPGVHYSQTASTPHGRLVRAVLANVVCDLPCARKVCGFMGHSSKSFLCSRCNVTRERIGEVDTPFGLRDTAFLREQAILWRDAGNISIRKGITEAAGIRWSDLWRLPYWDPGRQLVVDPMHYLLLGLIQNHFTTVFPLSLKVAESNAKDASFMYDFKQVPSPPDRVRIAEVEHSMSELEVQQVSDIQRMLQQAINAIDTEAEKARLTQRLASKHKVSLLFVADSLGLDISTADKRQDIADALSTWCFHFPLRSPTNIATTRLIEYIQHVIAFTTVPTSVRYVPRNFSSSGAGKIKADEWRTLCTIYLPIALVSYWYNGEECKDEAFKSRFKEVLDHTMELVQAINALFRKSLTPYYVHAYDRRIKAYIGQLRTVHPGANYVPNMHLATHMKDYMLLFGSPYSWWTYPFERLIGKLQDMQTNNRIGQVEGTMLGAFAALSRLRHRFPRENCPPGIEACFGAIDAVVDGEYEPLTDPPWDGPLVPPGDMVANEAALDIIKAKPNALFSRCRVGGVQYYAFSRHAGNSQIVFDLRDGQKAILGIIHYIVAGVSPVFIVQRVSVLPLGADPFRQYTDAPMMMFKPDPNIPLEPVDFAFVLGHFAAFEIGQGIFVASPIFS